MPPRLPDADRPSHATLRPDTRPPSFRCDPSARDVALDPGGTTMPRISASHMLRSTIRTVSAPTSSFLWLTPTSHAITVYASCSASLPPHATLASRRPATALPGPDLHRLIAPASLAPFLIQSPRPPQRATCPGQSGEHPRGLCVARACALPKCVTSRVRRPRTGRHGRSC